MAALLKAAAPLKADAFSRALGGCARTAEMELSHKDSERPLSSAIVAASTADSTLPAHAAPRVNSVGQRLNNASKAREAVGRIAKCEKAAANRSRPAK